jgi:hypothetical protein
MAQPPHHHHALVPVAGGGHAAAPSPPGDQIGLATMMARSMEVVHRLDLNSERFDTAVALLQQIAHGADPVVSAMAIGSFFESLVAASRKYPHFGSFKVPHIWMTYMSMFSAEMTFAIKSATSAEKIELGHLLGLVGTDALNATVKTYGLEVTSCLRLFLRNMVVAAPKIVNDIAGLNTKDPHAVRATDAEKALQIEVAQLQTERAAQDAHITSLSERVSWNAEVRPNAETAVNVLASKLGLMTMMTSNDAELDRINARLIGTSPALSCADKLLLFAEFVQRISDWLKWNSDHIAHLTGRIATLEGGIHPQQQPQPSFAAELQDMTTDRDRLGFQLDQMTIWRDAAVARVKSLSEEQVALVKTATEREAELTKAAGVQIDDLRKEKAELAKTVAEKEDELTKAAGVQIDDLRKEKAELAKTAAEKEAELTKLEDALATANFNKEIAEKRADSLQTQLAESRGSAQFHLDQANKKLEAMQKELETTRASLQRRQHEAATSNFKRSASPESTTPGKKYSHADAAAAHPFSS